MNPVLRSIQTNRYSSNRCPHLTKRVNNSLLRKLALSIYLATHLTWQSHEMSNFLKKRRNILQEWGREAQAWNPSPYISSSSVKSILRIVHRPILSPGCIADRITFLSAGNTITTTACRTFQAMALEIVS